MRARLLNGLTLVLVLTAGQAVAAAGAAGLTGPTPGSQPTVSGTVQQGRRLTATPGLWTGTGTVSYHYQWYRCDGTGAHCSSIHGATAQNYTLVAKDVGKTTGLTVRATDSTGTASAYASIVGPTAAPAAGLLATTQPKTTGTAVVGQAIAVDNGTWSSTPTSYTYAWQRCNTNGRICTPIAGATTATYTTTTTDLGHALLALVTAQAPTATQTTWSTATPAVTAAP